MPQNLHLALWFLCTVYWAICCLIPSGARMAKARTDKNKTPEDINLELTNCLMKYGMVYFLTFVAFLAMITDIVLHLKQLFL